MLPSNDCDKKVHRFRIMQNARIPFVVVFSKIPGLSAAILNRLGNINLKDVRIPMNGSDLDAASVATLQDAEILLADPGPVSDYKLSQALPKLKWLQSTWAGVDDMIRGLDKTKPVPPYHFTRFSGYFGQLMGEYVMGNIISRERQFADIRENQKQRIWDQALFSSYRPLTELTLGILGIGDIGKGVAKMAKACGMTVRGLVRQVPKPGDCCPDVDQYSLTEDLPVLLSNCDYICSVLPSTEHTRGLLNGDVLSHCTKKPVFINIGRGDVVDEDVLIKALDCDWLSHVVCDVFQTEPLCQNSPLWNHPKVTITPHVSGISLTHQVAELFIKNYERFITDENLLFPVNWQTGY